MSMWRLNPTIRETNKYLTETVDKLLKKHGSVSNEEFERELIELTGISWKQVKNYKNHPKPNHRLKDNSIVIKYVRNRQKKDLGRKARLIIMFCIVISLLSFGAYKIITAPKKIETFNVHKKQESTTDYSKLETRIFLKIQDLTLRLGPLKHSQIKIDNFNCSKLPNELINCTYMKFNEKNDFQVMLILDGDIVRKYTITTTDTNYIVELKDQLGRKIENFKLPNEPLAQSKFRVGDEFIEVFSNPNGPSSRAMLSVSVTFSEL